MVEENALTKPNVYEKPTLYFEEASPYHPLSFFPKNLVFSSSSQKEKKNKKQKTQPLVAEC